MLSACAPEQERVGEVQQALTGGVSGVSVNGFPLNGFPLNGFPLNGFPLNGFPLNGFPLNGFPLNGFPLNGFPLNGFPLNGFPLNGFPLNGYMISDRGSVDDFAQSELMQAAFPYVVACAAPEGVAVIVAPEDMAKRIENGETVDQEGVFPIIGFGNLGLAPEWLEGRCDQDCTEVLLACIGAHSNALAKLTVFSIGHPTRLQRTDCEADLFTNFEASYYAGVEDFRDPASPIAIHGVDVDLSIGDPPVNADPIEGAPIGVAARACIGDGECFINRVGWAQLPPTEICGRTDYEACTDANATSCTDKGFCDTPPIKQRWYDEILWVFRANRTVDITWRQESDKHYDFQGEDPFGKPLAPIMEARTICLQRLRAEPSMAHCFDKEYMPTACDDPKSFGTPRKKPGYDMECREWVLENCGPPAHRSLRQTGPPIPFGYSDCSDFVGSYFDHCSRKEEYGGWWDEKCVAAVDKGCLPEYSGGGGSCTDACTNGATDCTSGGDLRTCGDHDGDGCTEWQTIPCGAGTACEPTSGTCEPTCTSVCNPGDQRCTSTGSGVESCEDTDGDGCYEWSAGVTCAIGTACDPATFTCVDTGGCLPIGSPECSGGGGQESQI